MFHDIQKRNQLVNEIPVKSQIDNFSNWGAIENFDLR